MGCVIYVDGSLNVYGDKREEVEKEIVVADTYFLANSLSNLWLKKSNGDVRVFSLEEIVQKDDKDLLIENLQKQIEELKGGNVNEYVKSNDEQLYEQPSTKLNEQFGEPITEIKPSNVSSISKRKTTKRKS